ncbi:hypothetical protein SELMODRAFT_102265 [Selaginella moellendorffii]|uniref:Pterin-binding domain-containing protein n=1 Tax=Selaginella moellendorffii TaxID=88036 RepID=D8RUH6_SELML|nr:hypothetical protein SELMODRAFT_102265 [Selaginella moellendorffii]
MRIESRVAVRFQDATASGRLDRLSHRHFHSDEASTARVSLKSRKLEEVVIAIGGNIGDRVRNFDTALRMMRSSGIQIKKHACLYETAPMHLLDQPLFLNSAVTATTSLDPHELLVALKEIERKLGRSQGSVKYGPRPIDLDIIFYGNLELSSENLRVPHPMFSGRPFVLAPLLDLLGPEVEDSRHWSLVHQVRRHWNDIGGEGCVKREGMKKVLPVGGKLLDWQERTYVMGVLNVTPDSFSDGGKFFTADKAVKQVQEMIEQGADFIDVGAQSTRPNAERLTTEEELRRIVPVLEGLKSTPDRSRVVLSVDTFDSNVARAAVELGADLINDVSGGSLDPKMLGTVAELGVPCVLMHMRGDPCTMLSEANTSYSDLPRDVARELAASIEQAEVAGVPAWKIIADPGFGFSKTADQNVELLARLDTFRSGLTQARFGVGSIPVLAGISRKAFLGQIVGCSRAEDRDNATIAAATTAILKGANVIRAHNVKAVRDGAMVADSIRKVLAS